MDIIKASLMAAVCGGGGANLGTKSVTITQNGTVSYDASDDSLDGYSRFNITTAVPTEGGGASSIEALDTVAECDLVRGFSVKFKCGNAFGFGGASRIATLTGGYYMPEVYQADRVYGYVCLYYGGSFITASANPVSVCNDGYKRYQYSTSNAVPYIRYITDMTDITATQPTVTIRYADTEEQYVGYVQAQTTVTATTLRQGYKPDGSTWGDPTVYTQNTTLTLAIPDTFSVGFTCFADGWNALKLCNLVVEKFYADKAIVIP